MNFASHWLVADQQAKEPSVPYYLPIADEGKNGFTPFQKTLEWNKMERGSSSIWTSVTDSKVRGGS